jgi:SecY interacting protein Syd
MTDKNKALFNELSQFIQRYVNSYQDKYEHLPLIGHDEEWPSPCIQSVFKAKELDCWQPTLCTDDLTFTNVEEALEITLHSDIKTLFTSYYSDTLDANCEEGDLSLLLLWSEADFERLQGNIIGHILMKKKLKQELTVFFGVTDQDDFILSIKNDSGEVWVEQVGKEPHKKLADSLADFIQMLTPRIP